MTEDEMVGWHHRLSECEYIPGVGDDREAWCAAVQGTLKSLLQHHSSKATILLRSAFFIVQLSHPYMTTGKNYSLISEWILAQQTSMFYSWKCSLKLC